MNRRSFTFASMSFTLLTFVALAFAPGCQGYDALVAKDQTVQQKFADLQAQLQRRSDLVPNLVAVVQGAAKHESSTLEIVTQARASATAITIQPGDLDDAQKMAAFSAAQAKLGGALGRLFMANEAYPQLRALEAYHDLQIQLEGTENRILRSREEYNAAVADFNTELGKIHGQVINKVTGKPFSPRTYFAATADPGVDVQHAPKVQL
jgi:LemA protein